MSLFYYAVAIMAQDETHDGDEVVLANKCVIVGVRPSQPLDTRMPDIYEKYFPASEGWAILDYHATPLGWTPPQSVLPVLNGSLLPESALSRQ